MVDRSGRVAAVRPRTSHGRAVLAALAVATALLSGTVPARADTTPPSPPSPSATLRFLGPAQPTLPTTAASPNGTPTLASQASSAGLEGLGASASVSVSQLYDLARGVAASFIAPHLEPGGGSGQGDWTPPADVRTPAIPATPATANRSLTMYERLGAAYTSAAQELGASCHLPFALLAAIGEVESSSLRGRRLDKRGDVVPPVIGPALSGGRFASISDSDGGRLDGDPVWDHAVGPMQFIPATWRIWGADGNGDGVADPQNVDDAALAAGRYLCAGGRDLSRRADLEAAILSYNHSATYVRIVLGIVDGLTNGLVAGP